MSGMGTDPGSKSPGQIESEVERTRADVSGTLDALRGKLAPGQLMDQVVDQVTEYARGSGGAEFARNLGASVRDNPLPVALIGAGIAWLLLSKNGSGTSTTAPAPASGQRLLPAPRHEGAYLGSMPVGGADGGSDTGQMGTARARVSDAMESVQDRAGQVAGAAGDAVSRAGSAVGDAASRVTAAGSDLADSVSDAAGRAVHAVGALGHHAAGVVGGGIDSVQGGASSMARGVSRSVEDLAGAQPLLLGALGLALGAALGAILPRTQAEDRLMGEARDAVADRVGDAAREGYESVKASAGEGLGQVQERVADTYSEVKNRLDQGGLSTAGETLGKAAGDITRAAGDALRGVADEAKRSIAEGPDGKGGSGQG
ncbi:DUF3618 domain-containing protein [Roseomonas sp. WA12]